MEHITSRKNPQIQAIRALGQSRRAREEAGLYVLDGEKLLREAIRFGAQVETVLWAEQAAFALPDGVRFVCDRTDAIAPLLECGFCESAAPDWTLRWNGVFSLSWWKSPARMKRCRSWKAFGRRMNSSMAS